MTFLLLTVYFIQSTVYCQAFGTFLDVLVQFQMFMDSLGCFWTLLDSLVQGNQGNVLKNTTSSCRQLRTSSRVSQGPKNRPYGNLKEHDKEMGYRGGGKEISPNAMVMRRATAPGTRCNHPQNRTGHVEQSTSQSKDRSQRGPPRRMSKTSSTQPAESVRPHSGYTTTTPIKPHKTVTVKAIKKEKSAIRLGDKKFNIGILKSF